MALLLGILPVPDELCAEDRPQALDDLQLLYPTRDLFITATQSAHTLDRAPAIATVVTAREIRDMGARNLLDVLATVPGMGVGFAGSYAAIDTVSVRGLKTDDSEKILLLIDGHRVNALVSGSPTHYFDDFPLDAVRRIEIIRGPGSALYGANAFTAVVNVIMVKPGDFEGSRATLGGGNADTTRQNLLLGRSEGAFAWLAAYDHLDTNGTRDRIDRDAAGAGGTTHFWRDNHTAYARGRYGDLELTGLVVHKHRGTALGLSQLVDTRSDLRFQHAYGRLQYARPVGTAHTESSLSVDQIGWDPDWQLEVPGFAAIANPQTTTRAVAGDVRVALPPAAGHNLALGLEVEHDRSFDVRHVLDGVDVTATANHAIGAHRTMQAVFLQDEWETGTDTVVTAGVRWDHYSDFGGSVNPRLAVVWSASPALTAKVLYGRAFRPPTFEDLYEMNNPIVIGNPDVKPEVMNTVEGGLVWQSGRVYTLSGNVFFNRFSKRIVRGAPMTANGGGADIWGTELELKADWRAQRHGYLNWSWQTSHDESTGLRLTDVPRHQVKGGVNRGLFGGRLNTNLQARWAGPQSRPVGDPRRPLGSRAVLDAALRADRLAPGLSLGLSIHNLLDRRYADPSPAVVPAGYPRPGRTWLVEATYRF